MKKLLIIGIMMFFALSACNKENFEKAKAALAKDETRQDVQLSVLFDNSISYKEFVDDTLNQVKWLFQYMAAKHPDAEVSLILLDSESRNIFNGKARNLQMSYDELRDILRNRRSDYTDLTGGVERAIYFLTKGEARRKILLIFSDMKASTPEFHPGNEEIVPPPPDFPWEELKSNNIETHAFYVPFKEWKEWLKVMKDKELVITSKLPEELKAVRVPQIIFDNED